MNSKICVYCFGCLQLLFVSLEPLWLNEILNLKHGKKTHFNRPKNRD